MRACTHGGVEHTDNESAQHFDSEKLSQFVLVLRTGFEPLVIKSIGSRGRYSTNWATTYVPPWLAVRGQVCWLVIYWTGSEPEPCRIIPGARRHWRRIPLNWPACKRSSCSPNLSTAAFGWRLARNNKKSKTEMTASVQENKSKHTRGYGYMLPLTKRQTDKQLYICNVCWKFCTFVLSSRYELKSVHF